MNLSLSLTGNTSLVGSLAPSPLVISNYSNTTVTSLAADWYLIQKTGGAAAWDAAAKGSATLTGDFQIWWKHTDASDAANSVDVFVGCDAADVSTAGFADMDFAVNTDLFSWSLYQNNTAQGISGSWAANNNFRCIARSGSDLKVYENSSQSLSGATLLGTFPGTTANPVYFKSVIFQTSAFMRAYAISG